VGALECLVILAYLYHLMGELKQLWSERVHYFSGYNLLDVAVLGVRAAERCRAGVRAASRGHQRPPCP
jgi:hypothetical protein